MQLRISPSMRSITISSSNGVVDSMKVRVAPQPPPPPPPPHGAARRGGGGGGGWYCRAVAFPVVVALGCLLPFAFILAAVPALEAGGSKCSSVGKMDSCDLVAFFSFFLGLVSSGWVVDLVRLGR